MTMDGRALGDAVGSAFVTLGCLCLVGGGVVGAIVGAIVVGVLWWIFQ